MINRRLLQKNIIFLKFNLVSGSDTQLPLQLKESIERELPQEALEWQRCVFYFKFFFLQKFPLKN